MFYFEEKKTEKTDQKQDQAQQEQEQVRDIELEQQDEQDEQDLESLYDVSGLGTDFVRQAIQEFGAAMRSGDPERQRKARIAKLRADKVAALRSGREWSEGREMVWRAQIRALAQGQSGSGSGSILDIIKQFQGQGIANKCNVNIKKKEKKEVNNE